MDNAIRTYSHNTKLVALQRKQIARSAAYIITKKGYHKTSIREIAEACRMGMGSLYRYVGSKEDILYLVIEDGLSQFLEFSDNVYGSLDSLSPTEGLQEAIERYLRTIDQVQDMILLAYQDIKNLRPDAQQRIIDRDRRVVAAFEALLTRGCEAGEFEINNITIVAQHIVTIGVVWAIRRWFWRKWGTLEEYIREQTRFILGAIHRGKVAH